MSPHFCHLVLLAWKRMDILIEFLESSTIHGLNYISTAKVSGEMASCVPCTTNGDGDLELDHLSLNMRYLKTYYR